MTFEITPCTFHMADFPFRDLSNNKEQTRAGIVR